MSTTTTTGFGSGGWGMGPYGDPTETDTADHTTVSIQPTDRDPVLVTVLNQPPGGVAASVAGGVASAPDLVVGDFPLCMAATGDDDRCTRELDSEELAAGERTCWQHDESDIPEGGW